jgi:hypothetical protein
MAAGGLPAEGLPAVWRERAGADWCDAEIVGRHRSGGWLLRETGRFWPGVWLAAADRVRATGPILVLEPQEGEGR